MGKNRNTGQKSNRKPGPNFNQADGQPLEDRALKMGAALFGAELLKALGVEKKILRIAPTEQVYLNIKEFQEDFNYEMVDGSWFHFGPEKHKKCVFLGCRGGRRVNMQACSFGSSLVQIRK